MIRCPTSLEIQSYIDGELPSLRAAEIGGHLARCGACQRRAGELTAISALLHSLADLPPAGRRPSSIPASGGRPQVYAWRWMLVPAAAALLLGAIVSWRHFAPPGGDSRLVSFFIEAHRADLPGEGLPEPCDFGLSER